jgi:S1-C subfamily serine protease
VKAVQPSVVEITSVSGNQEAIGSGEILTTDGYIVTNDHVVQGFNQFTVTLSNGSNKSAQLVGQDAQDDLAVLKISATGLKPIAFGDSSKVQVGEFSIAVGNPLGLQQSATFGIVSALNRTASEAPSGPAGTLTGLIQTSAPINPGNSGGALVDLSGTLIGIPTLGAIDPETGTAANGIGYAIPSNRVQYVAQQLIAHGQLTSSGQGFIGIQGEDVTPQLAQADNLPVQSGVLITAFANDAAGQSPAQQAGLQQGDIITAVNGQPIGSSSDLSGILLTKAPGTQVSLTILRGTSQQSVTVTLGERPATAG